MRLVSFVLLLFIAFPENATSQSWPCKEPYSRPFYNSRGFHCASGELVEDFYSNGHLIPCEEMEVDHLISIRQAWESGICGDDLKKLANDPRNQKFTHWRTNRLKGRMTPEEFSRIMPDEVASKVLSDARKVRLQYKIPNWRDSISIRMAIAANSSSAGRVLRLSKIPRQRIANITFKKVGRRTGAFLGKRLIGYAVGGGVAIEAISVSAWAANWLTSPTQTDAMQARASFFRKLFEMK